MHPDVDWFGTDFFLDVPLKSIYEIPQVTLRVLSRMNQSYQTTQ